MVERVDSDGKGLIEDDDEWCEEESEIFDHVGGYSMMGDKVNGNPGYDEKLELPPNRID